MYVITGLWAETPGGGVNKKATRLSPNCHLSDPLSHTSWAPKFFVISWKPANPGLVQGSPDSLFKSVSQPYLPHLSIFLLTSAALFPCTSSIYLSISLLNSSPSFQSETACLEFRSSITLYVYLKYAINHHFLALWRVSEYIETSPQLKLWNVMPLLFVWKGLTLVNTGYQPT